MLTSASMTTWTLFHNPKCSKSREALEFLQAQSHLQLTVVEYLKETPNEATLKSLIADLTTPLETLVRTKEDEFKAAPFDVTSKEQVLQNLLETPKLLERPILHGHGKAIIGRPLENIKAALG